jgi:subtilase family serine protease
MVRRSLIALGAAALAVPVVAVGGLGSAGAASPSVPLDGSVLPSARVAANSPAVPRSERIRFQVQLRLRDQAGADALALAVSTPGNAQYRKYLTPDQYRARFAPTPASVDKVSAWLAAQGLKVTAVPANRAFIEAEGSAAQVETAFQTSLVTVDSNGQQRRVNTAAPAVPATLIGSVDGVTGLSDVQMKPTHVGGADEAPANASAQAAEAAAAAAGTNAPPSPGFRVAPPCSAFWNEQQATDLPPYDNYPNPLPWAPCGYTPDQLRSGYGVAAVLASGIDGSGVTVAIVDAYASPTIVTDATTYAQRHDPTHPFNRSQFSQKAYRPFYDGGPNKCNASGWYGEETLDVEAVHSMAPGANIYYVGVKSCNSVDFIPALNDLVDGHKADIVSNSYGNAGESTEADRNATVRIHTQAAIQGIGFYYSSGDSGDESNSGYGGPIPAADFPASSPLATAVGGTSLGVDASGNVVLERGWTTGVSGFDPATRTYTPGPRGDFLYGAGGGPSRVYAQPDYQKGVVPNNIATSIGQPKRRVVPDVGMVGDPNTGFLVGQTQTFPEGVSYDEYRIGGTSLSSPLFAGIMALADQQAGAHHGFANPFLYSLAGSTALRDITPGPKSAVARNNFNNSVDPTNGVSTSVRTIDADLQSLRTLNGYDTLTGLGAPNGASFVGAG